MKIKKVSKTLYGLGQLINKPFMKKLNLTINDNVTQKLNKPYLILANHSSVMDYRITATVLKDVLPYHVSAQNQFAHRKTIMFKVGALPKVQFRPSCKLVRDIERAIKQNECVVIFAEGVVSFDGTNREIPYSLAKLAKFLKVPVAVMNIKGTYLIKPRYNEVFHHTDKTVVDFNVALTKEQVMQKNTDQIYESICNALRFNVWEWNKQNDVKTHFDDMYFGLDNLLFTCPNCGSATKVKDDTLICQCGDVWHIDEFYRLNDGKTEYDIHQWCEKQREYLKKEIQNNFEYKANACVSVMTGLNGFKKVGKGIYIQTVDGVVFDGEIKGKPVKLMFKSKHYYSAPAGNYFIEFTNNDATYRFYFDKNGFAIKSAMMVEEVYKQLHKK